MSKVRAFDFSYPPRYVALSPKTSQQQAVSPSLARPLCDLSPNPTPSLWSLHLARRLWSLQSPWNIRKTWRWKSSPAFSYYCLHLNASDQPGSSTTDSAGITPDTLLQPSSVHCTFPSFIWPSGCLFTISGPPASQHYALWGLASVALLPRHANATATGLLLPLHYCLHCTVPPAIVTGKKHLLSVSRY